MATLPDESMRSLSVPPVSKVILSFVGNLIAVFVSLLWTILSDINTSPCASNVDLAVIIPTESILVTSSYVIVPAIATLVALKIPLTTKPCSTIGAPFAAWFVI